MHARARLLCAAWTIFAACLGCTTLSCRAGTSSTNCALDSCNSGAVVKTFANISRDAMAQATITACVNDGCASGIPASVPSTPGDRLSVALQGGVTVQGFLSSPDGANGYVVEADFTLNDANPVNGDTYKLYVTSGGVQVPGGVNQTATYVSTAPNGPDCPPVCENATIDQTKSK